MLNFTKSLFLNTAVVLTALSISPTYAQGTPDGMTPANEGICDDMLAGNPDLTKGLYGLCVAYCEAIDGPEDLSNTALLDQLRPPSKRILENYNRKKTDTDPEMPCVNYGPSVECPIWDDAKLALVGTLGLTNFYNDEETIGNGFVLLEDKEQDIRDNGTAGDTIRASTYDYGDTAWVLYYRNVSGYTYESNFIQLTGDGWPDTLNACKQDIFANNPVR